jgi:hypothetical protein
MWYHFDFAAGSGVSTVCHENVSAPRVHVLNMSPGSCCGDALHPATNLKKDAMQPLSLLS